MDSLVVNSINIIKDYQHYSGAFISSPYVESYKYCFIRDSSFIAHALDIYGCNKESSKFFMWSNNVFLSYSDKIKKAIKRKNHNEVLLNSDYLPAIFTVEGKEIDEWPNYQFDGQAIWLWALCNHIKINNIPTILYSEVIELIANYLATFWKCPCYDCWEEKEDKVHTSTLICICGAFIELEDLFPNKGYGDIAKEIKDFILENCVFEKRLSKYAYIDDIDSSLLFGVVPFNIFDTKDEIMQNTVKEIENKLLIKNGLHRFPTDFYFGGGRWINLTCLLAWYYKMNGNQEKSLELIEWIEQQQTEKGELPEQVLDIVINPDYIEKWHDIFGEVASPSLWAHGMYLIVKHKII